MTSFAHIDYPVQHAGVARVERAARSLKQTARSFDSSRSAATLLLAALVSALLVVANQVVDTWTEGGLLAAWIALWTVAFAAIALLAAPARRAGRVLGASWERLGAARRQARADREYWEAALLDARVMADISRAMASGDVAVDLRNYR
ncbi:hypothetical protein PE066_10860 [Ramlibacter tataouinensis]|uniref:hypothetical protein n=1 Tax=Ramlibacter tataouinensis TaxID=94132 RepID=UPI0022F3D27B|nr:hypothetical protein [Ramlibacter tataouinensis]WBX99985.1 hypothetical protein PE066_10860 [Ramlibacter tataouinensis]